MQPENDYRAYLLRVWRPAGAGWRVTLEDAHSGERCAFASLAELLAHLERTANGRALADPNPSDEPDG